MAKLKRPLNSEKARGHIDGIIFSESNNVNYARKRTIPKYKYTEKRKEVANRLALASAGWQRMTDEERKNWEDFAKTTTERNAFGEKYTKPAFAWYVACRENLYSIGKPKVPNIIGAEFPETPNAITYQAPAFWSSYLELYISHDTTSAKWIPRLYISKQKSPSRIFNFSECRLWKADSANGSILKFSMTTSQYNDFKGVYTLFAQLVDRDSGLAGELYKQKVEFT